MNKPTHGINFPGTLCFSKYKDRIFPFDVTSLLSYIKLEPNEDNENLINNFLLEFNEKTILTDDSIKDFVNFSETKIVDLEIEKLFPLYYIANILNNTNLIELIESYFFDHTEDFINQLYHISTTQNNIKNQYFENIVSEHLLDYVKYEKLALFKISTLHRILTKYKLKNGSLENQKIYDFLFEILLKHGTDASVLFLLLDHPMKNKYIIKKLLIDEYSEIFDFHYIDESFCKSTCSNQNALIKQYLLLNNQQDEVIETLKSEQEIELKKLREEINEINEEKSHFVTNLQQDNDLDNIRNELAKLKENMSLFVTQEHHETVVKKLKDEINELKEENIRIQLVQSNKLDKLNKVVYESSKCTGSNDNLEVFNSLSGESQNFIFSGLLSFKFSTQINQKIGSLLLFLSKENQKSKREKDIKENYVYICSKQMNESLSKLTSIDSIEIKANIVSILYENGSLDSEEFINNINNFDDLISIEFQYPLLNKKVYEIIKNMKQTKCHKLKINLLISGIEKTTKVFQKQQEINKITLDSSVKIITGGLGEGSFEFCSNVTELSISNSITLIGGGAFNSLHNLKELNLPSSVEVIEGGAFSECFLLTEITFPPELKEIHSNAFRRCRNLKNIFIDPYNTKIRPNAFPECPLLKHFTLHPSIKNITKFDFDNTSLYDIRELIIPETVTSISSDAFSNCRNLYKITILPSMKSVGCIGADYLQCIEINPYQTNIDYFVAPALNHFVFHSSVDCIEHINLSLFRNVKKITIPDTVKSIAPGSFYGYSSLEEITIPNSIVSIEFDTFKECKKLKNVTIPSSVKKIHGGVFCQCSSLEEITIPNSVEFIGGGCFSYCKSLKKITFPESLKSIENHLFFHCDNLHEVNIPNTMSLICRNAFDCCQNLQNITIPESLNVIGYKAFVGMSIRTITIPKKVASIKDEAFCGCLNLFEVKFDANSNLIEIGKNAFYKCISLKLINIPDNVNSIGEGAFKECSQLEEILLPKRLTAIENDLFYHCTSLKIIDIKNNYDIKTIGAGAFNNCAITEIIFPYSIISIGCGAFYCCEKLQNVSLSYDLETIEEYAFYGCKSLSSIILFQVSYLGQGAFENCELISLSIYSQNITKIEPYTFKNCTSLHAFSFNQFIKSIGKDAFLGCPLDSLVLSSPLTSIEEWSFHGCNLIEIEIPSSVTSIENNAFYDCKHMKNITIPSSVKTIGDYSFYNCRSLRQIEIPKSVKRIGKYAFSRCVGLVKVTFENDSLLIEFEEYLFSECNSLKQVQIPSSVTSIGKYAFNNCGRLEYVEFDNPCNVTEFGSFSFRGCNSLTQIKIPNSIRKVGDYAFSNCNNLQPFSFPSNVTVGINVFYNPKKACQIM